MSDINIFLQVPDCISSRLKLKGVLSDFYPLEKRKINLILNAYDEGIATFIIHAEQLDAIAFNRWTKVLTDNYGLSNENAEWVVDYWFSEYGVSVCHLEYDIAAKKQNLNDRFMNIEVAVKKEDEKRIWSDEDTQTIEIASLLTEEKIPDRMNITFIFCRDYSRVYFHNCATRKKVDYSDGTSKLEVSGEYSGYSDISLLIHIMIYNAEDELIAFSSDHEVDAFSGNGTFSEEIYVPQDEIMSWVVIRASADPAFV